MNAANESDLTLGDIARLEDVLDREALRDVCRSFFDLFGISIRVFSRSGTLLADVHEQQEICTYVNTLSAGRTACGDVVSRVKNVDPSNGTVVHACFTGAVYRIVPLSYQSRRVGRFVIGPYLPVEQIETPPTLLAVDQGFSAARAGQALAKMPRVRAETAERIANHFQGIFDLILFASHRAHLTSEMHVASVRESYRELAEKNSKLQVAFDQLKELDQLKSNFLATISHELRTPLTSIIGYSEMLVTGLAGDLNQEQHDFVRTIRNKGDQLLALISGLLDLSKLERGELQLNRNPLDAADLIEDVAVTLRPQADRKKVSLSVEIEGDLPHVLADSMRMRQVLQNLADNALKFTPTGGSITLRARAATFEPPDSGGLGFVLMATPRPALEFEVADSGIGIPEDQHERIFDAFYQVDGSTTREHEGAGLGLSIVRRIVDAHGGRIQIHSQTGKGTRVAILIPEPEESPR